MPSHLDINTILESPYLSEYKVDRSKPRTPFKINREEDPKAETEVLLEASRVFQSLLERKVLRKEAFGQAMCHNYVRFLAETGVGRKRILTPQQIEEVKNVDHFYGEIMGNDYPSIKKGAIREFGAMLSTDIALSHLNLRSQLAILHAKPEEDLYYGTDFVIQNKLNGALYGIQVKSFPMAQNLEHMIIPYGNDGELENGVDRIISHSVFGQPQGNQSIARERRAGLITSGGNLLHLQDQNAPYIGHAFLIIPSEAETGLIDEFSGIPGKDLYTQIGRDLQSEILIPDPKFTNG